MSFFSTDGKHKVNSYMSAPFSNNSNGADKETQVGRSDASAKEKPIVVAYLSEPTEILKNPPADKTKLRADLNTSLDYFNELGEIMAIRYLRSMRKIQRKAGYNDNTNVWPDDGATEHTLLYGIRNADIDSDTKAKIEAKYNWHVNPANDQYFNRRNEFDKWKIIYMKYAEILIDFDEPDKKAVPDNLTLYNRLKQLNSLLSTPLSLSGNLSNFNLEKFSEDIANLSLSGLAEKEINVIHEMMTIGEIMSARYLRSMRKIQRKAGYNDNTNVWPDDRATEHTLLYGIRNADIDSDTKAKIEAKYNWHVNPDNDQYFNRRNEFDKWKIIYMKYAEILIKFDEEIIKFDIYGETKKLNEELCPAVQLKQPQKTKMVFNEATFLKEIKELEKKDIPTICTPPIEVDRDFIRTAYKIMGKELNPREESILKEELLNGTIAKNDIESLAIEVYKDDPEKDSLNLPDYIIAEKYRKEPDNFKKELTRRLAHPMAHEKFIKLDKNIYRNMAVMRKLDADGIKLRRDALVFLSDYVPPNWHWKKEGGTIGLFPTANSYVYSGFIFNDFNSDKTLGDNKAIEDAIKDANDDGFTYNVGLHLENQFTTPSWLRKALRLGGTYNSKLDLNYWNRKWAADSPAREFDITLGVKGGGKPLLGLAYEGEIGLTKGRADTPSFDDLDGVMGHGQGKLLISILDGLPAPYIANKWEGGQRKTGFSHKFFEGYFDIYPGVNIPLGPEDYRGSIDFHIIRGWYTRESIKDFSGGADMITEDYSTRLFDKMVKRNIKGLRLGIKFPLYNLPILGKTGLSFDYQKRQIEDRNPTKSFDFKMLFKDGKGELGYSHIKNPKPLTTEYTEQKISLAYNDIPLSASSKHRGLEPTADIFIEAGRRNFKDGPDCTIFGGGVRFKFGRTGEDKIIGDSIVHQGDAIGKPGRQVKESVIYGAGSPRNRSQMKDKLEFNELKIAGINTLHEARRYVVTRFLEMEDYEVKGADGRIDKKKLKEAIVEYTERKNIENKRGVINDKLIKAINSDLIEKNKAPQELTLSQNDILGATIDTNLHEMRLDNALTEESINIVLQDALRMKLIKDQGVEVQPSGVSSNDPVAKLLYYAYTKVGEIKNLEIEFEKLGTPKVSGEIEWASDDDKAKILEKYKENTGKDEDNFKTQFMTEIKSGTIGLATYSVLQALRTDGSTLPAIPKIKAPKKQRLIRRILGNVLGGNEVKVQRAESSKGVVVASKKKAKTPVTRPVAKVEPVPVSYATNEKSADTVVGHAAPAPVVERKRVESEIVYEGSVARMKGDLRERFVASALRDGQRILERMKNSDNIYFQKQKVKNRLNNDLISKVKAVKKINPNTGTIQFMFTLVGTISQPREFGRLDASTFSVDKLKELMEYRNQIIKQDTLPGTAEFGDKIKAKINELAR